MENKRSLINGIMGIVSIAVGIFIFASSFIFKKESYYHHILLGSVLLLTSSVDTFNTILIKKKTPLDYANLIINTMLLMLSGWYFGLEVSGFDIEPLIITWGVLEAVDGLLELINVFYHANNKTPAYSLCGLFLIKIIFGIILAIKLQHGVFVHLIITGILFVLLPILHQLYVSNEGHKK